MIKKIFVGILLAGVFGLLILGAVNRTLAKSNNVEPLALSEGNGRGNGTVDGYNNGSQLNQTEDNAGQGRNNAGTLLRRNSEISGNDSTGSGGLNNGQGNGAGKAVNENPGVGLADVQNWEDPITVKVDSISPDLWIVSNNEGFYLEIEGRTLRYLQDNNFTASPGEELVLIGFYDNETYEVGSITNKTTQLSLDIRDTTGRPLWAGGGRGNTAP